ncbi:thioredoxin [Natronomonas sp. F2-12]|jgi:thioredoxin 1|uniref:Thioredoxin n=1 Tax=Natronomonas aquatica TaxID=2841590 RepID=A0A9R1D377_9EURY|nr:thioredoxin [Natronomonas aquatica]MCQ4332039.1 thioredoxin [Natronomonas aquatica]
MSSEIEPIPSEPIQLTDESDLESAVSTHEVVLVDFYADWCGPCRMMEPTIEALAAETDAAVLKVDVDRFQGLAGQYGVQGIPALLLFADGDLVERFVGVQQADDLKQAIVQQTG